MRIDVFEFDEAYKRSQEDVDKAISSLYETRDEYLKSIKNRHKVFDEELHRLREQQRKEESRIKELHSDINRLLDELLK